MEKLTLFKNKPETFNCQFSISGADSEEAFVRLCLEFNDNKNMYFNGVLNENGFCSIDIPPINEVDDKKGILYIEAVVDQTYFKVYEAEVDVKNSVEIKLLKTESSVFRSEKSNNDKEVKLEQVTQKAAPKTKRKSKPKQKTPNPFVPISEHHAKKTLTKFDEYRDK